MKMSKKKKVILVMICSIALIGAVIGIKYLMDVKSYKEELAAISIENLDLSEIEDGSYLGAYDATFIKVEIKVDVEDHKIIDIDLIEHENGKGQPAEAIIPKVLEVQSLQVDTVTGATNSSKVILKAIEIALGNGKI